MYEFLPEDAGSLLALRVSGKLSEADYNQLGQHLSDRVAKEGTLRILIEMRDFKGWETFAAMWEDLKLDVKHYRDIERIAMVGDEAWQEWMTKLSTPFLPGHVRYFELTARDEAVAWLKAA